VTDVTGVAIRVPSPFQKSFSNGNLRIPSLFISFPSDEAPPHPASGFRETPDATFPSRGRLWVRHYERKLIIIRGKKSATSYLFLFAFYFAV
jgi:hypothetical protein